jgi:hypothetical protein
LVAFSCRQKDWNGLLVYLPSLLRDSFCCSTLHRPSILGLGRQGRYYMRPRLHSATKPASCSLPFFFSFEPQFVCLRRIEIIYDDIRGELYCKFFLNVD